MPRILTTLCTAIVLMPMLAAAQSNSRLTDGMSNVSDFTPAVTYPVNQSGASNTTRSTVQTATPATNQNSNAARPTVSQAPAPAARPAAASTASTARPAELIGDTTNALLAMQAQGKHSGTSLPTLGATAGPAWKRYVDSFSHPLPEWFQEKVEESSN